ASAARPKCRSRATATMYLSSVKVMMVSWLKRSRSGAQVILPIAHPAIQMRLGMLREFIGQQSDRLLCLFGDARVGFQTGKAKQSLPRLAHAQKLTRPAKVKVALGYFKSVSRLVHSPQAVARNGRKRPLIHQYANGGRTASADPTAQLV